MFSFLAICLLTFVATFLPDYEDVIAALMLGAHCFSAACFAVVSFQTFGCLMITAFEGEDLHL